MLTDLVCLIVAFLLEFQALDFDAVVEYVLEAEMKIALMELAG